MLKNKVIRSYLKTKKQKDEFKLKHCEIAENIKYQQNKKVYAIKNKANIST